MPDRNYADEWLPSRFSLGTLRLIAYVISSSLERRKPTSGAYLNRQPHQHPLEANLLAVAYWLIPTLQFALLAGEGVGRWSRLAASLSFGALLFAVPIAWMLVTLLFTPLASKASKLTGRSTHDIQALVTRTGMLVLAVVSVVRGWPGRPLGWFWIGITVVELAASLGCFVLRSRFEALDRRLPSEAP